MITELKDNEIFVFGSNLAGNHLGGSALFAYENFNAIMGVGEGLTGRCYAFPTLDKYMQKRKEEELIYSIINLIMCAKIKKNKVFLLTKVGCGIAGYKEEYIKTLFNNKDLPKNIILPRGW
jgi:hypothetical protein